MNMIIKAITNPDLLQISDKSTQSRYYGCSQIWYSSEWQRRAGCGPSTASNLFHYLIHSNPLLDRAQIDNSKEAIVALMKEIWEYITPGFLGVNKTKIFYKGFLAYAKMQGINIEQACFNVPQRKASRHELADLLLFLEEAIAKNAPVAFLNLDHGEEKNLDSWHWVTIISIEFTEDRKTIYATIFDGGLSKKIDLGLWYNTTTLGGGFVYFKQNK